MRPMTIQHWMRTKIGLTAIGCGASAEPTPNAPLPLQQAGPGQTITLGDIDAREPVKKIKRFTPLANYLASHLNEFGIVAGNVVISRTIEEVGATSQTGQSKYTLTALTRRWPRREFPAPRSSPAVGSRGTPAIGAPTSRSATEA